MLVICKNCGKEFNKREADIKRSINHFCSRSCAFDYRKNNKNITLLNCKNCNVEFEKKDSEIKKSNNNFCSHSCAAKFNNKQHPKRTKKIWSCEDCGNEISYGSKYCCKCYGKHKRKNWDNMTEKFCPHCERTLPIDNFIKNKSRFGYYSYCKKCCSELTVERQNKLKLQCIEYKGIFACQNCGYDKYISALEFHHTNPEEKDFTLSRHNCVNFNDEIKQEIDKCMLLCANCHRELHYELNNKRKISNTSERQRKFKERCIDYKGGKCKTCECSGSNVIFDFHHRSEEYKEFTIGSKNTHPFNEIITAELDKCDLLCANCHREVHAELEKIKKQNN